MRNADFVTPAARLEDALKRLEQVWQNTKEDWADSVSQTVEDEYLIPLHNQLTLMDDAIRRLSEVMGRAERECLHQRESGPTL